VILGSKGFQGVISIGIAVDQDVLIKAGISDCDVAVTDSDNVNMMVSQMVKKVYNIKNVQALVFEPSIANSFKDIGIKLICPTEDSTNKICASLSVFDNDVYSYIGKTTIVTKIVDIDKKYIGVRIVNIPIPVILYTVF